MKCEKCGNEILEHINVLIPSGGSVADFPENLEDSDQMIFCDECFETIINW